MFHEMAPELTAVLTALTQTGYLGGLVASIQTEFMLKINNVRQGTCKQSDSFLYLTGK